MHATMLAAGDKMKYLVTFFILFTTLFAQNIKYSYDPYPPFTYEDKSTQTIKGVSIDVLNALFSRMNQPFESELNPWSYVLKELQTGAADVTFPLPIQEEEILLFPSRFLWSGSCSIHQSRMLIAGTMSLAINHYRSVLSKATLTVPSGI